MRCAEGALGKEASIRGAGRPVFAAVLLTIAGTLNIMHGIAAISDAHFFEDTTPTCSPTSTPGAGSP